MGEDPKSEAYQDVMDSFAKATKPPKLSEKGEEAYLMIQGLQDARYEIAKITGNIRDKEVSRKVKDDIISMEYKIAEGVAALPKKDRDLITERLKEDPKAYYSAWAVVRGIENREETDFSNHSFYNEIERRIGNMDELYNRVKASMYHDRDRIAGPGSETYEMAKGAWEKARDSGDLKELPEEEKRYLEEYFGREKKEEVRKDLETEVKKGKIGGPGSYTHERAKEAWEKVKDSNLNWQKLPEEEKQIWEEYFGGEKEEGVIKDVERKAKEESK